MSYDDGTSFGNEWFCDYCYNETYCDCESCQTEIPKDDDYCYNGMYYCENCFDDTFFVCPDCSDLFPVADGVTIREEDYCSDCADDHEGNSIHSYGYKPTANFHGIKGPYFGIELEVSDYQENIRSTESQAEYLLEKIESFAYLKYDCSISNCGHDGFEIVTHPINWDWIHDHPKALDPIFNLKKIGFESFDTGSCGMHIHVCKKHLTSLQMYKLMMFFDFNTDFIFNISQRNRSQLDRWAPIKTGYRKTRLAKDRGGGDRGALNLRGSDAKTIEFRLFRGTLDRGLFFKNLEFVTAILEFTSAAKYSLKEMKSNLFQDYVKQHKNRFNNLHEFINSLSG